MDNDQGNNNGAPAADNDDAEWEQALESYQADRGVEPAAPTQKKEDEENGKPNPDKPADQGNKPAPDAGTNGDQGKKPEANGEQPNGKKPEGEEDPNKQPKAPEVPDNPAAREYRRTAQEVARQEQEMKEDIRKELFSDVQTQLLDSDGDPIESIEDVMKLKNPNTGKAFTEDEAAAWLLKAQQNLAKTNQETESKIESIAQVNLDLMDQADAVKAKYGALLKTMPDIAKDIVAEFNASLKTDPKTGYILEAPLNMERFFDIAMKPYQLQAQQLEALNKQEQDRIAKEEAEKKEQKKKQTRQDRSDIYGGGKVETMDEDEKEWAAAAENYYGKR